MTLLYFVLQDGQSILFHAVNEDNKEFVEEIIKMKACISLVDKVKNEIKNKHVEPILQHCIILL